MHLDLHYTDPQLVSIYDLENAGRDDIDFYLGLAAELGARSVIDLGCGTGVLAADLAAAGLDVTGVDPASAMLDAARARPGGNLVDWVEGDATALAGRSADLIVMTGHVAQVFLDDQLWNDTVALLFEATTPGGHLVFETRNPDAESWTHWNRETTTATFQTAEGGTFTSWVEITDVSPGLVSFAGHNIFDDDEFAPVSSTLRFRSRREIEESLTSAGFWVEQLFGTWARGPVSKSCPELIFVARKRRSGGPADPASTGRSGII